MLIHVKPMTSRYACLSYVWGDPSNSDRPFSNSISDAPKLIHDAAFVTCSVGIQFLWVDRYCINQRDRAAKHAAIANIGSIYHGACLTIIAASGDGPHEGLPGVRGTPRRSSCSNLYTVSQHLQPTGYEGKITTFHDPAYEISNSTWNTRGWTFQETLLSRRRLAFTPTQMYFQCSCSTWQDFEVHESQDHTLQDTARSLNHSVNSPVALSAHDAGVFRSLRNFYHQIEEYFPRFLSFRTDLLNAVVGICHQHARHHKYPVRELFGIPCFRDPKITPARTIATGLGWTLSRNRTWSRPNNADSLYPSWSWAFAKTAQGVNSCGELEFPEFDHNDPGAVWDANFEVQIVQVSGQMLSVNAFLDGPWSNEDLTREIVVTAWAICVGDAEIQSFSRGLNPEHKIYLDYPLNSVKVGTMAIYLGIQGFRDPQHVASFLLVEETGIGRYQRIEVFHHYGYDRKRRVNEEIGVVDILGSLQPAETWQRRCLRFV